jgi:hypothetical protein
MATSLSLENDSSLAQGYLKVNGSTAATITTSGIGPATSLVSGIISAQSALKTDTQVGGTGAGTETDITGLSLSVVVPSSTAKVLLLGYVTQSGLYAGYRIKRNGTDVALGDAAGTRTRLLLAGGDEAYNATSAKSIPINFLDSPNAAGTYTYKVTGVCSFSVYSPNINRAATDTDNTYVPRATSQLIALVIP